MSEVPNITLKQGSEIANEAVQRMTLFQTGQVKPISTGIEHLDGSLLGGLLPGTVVTIAGYSFHGKSYELEEAQRHIADHHPDVIMLQCAWELEGFKSITRELSYRTKKSVKDILFNPPSQEDLSVFNSTVNKYRRDSLFFQPEPVTSDQFETDVMYLINSYPDRRIVVCIDNLENILNSKGDQKRSMDELLYRVNILKKRHPFIAFIILNQLNNDILGRIDNPKAHMPIAKDIYGTGQLFKLSDVVVIKVMPTKFGIQDKYMVFGKKMYPHLDDFKLPSKTKTTSFDPFGKIFYFYLKARETDKDFQTVYAKEIYTREDMGLPPVESDDVPVFNKDKKEETVIIPTAQMENPDTKALKSARSSFEQGTNDAPF